MIPLASLSSIRQGSEDAPASRSPLSISAPLSSSPVAMTASPSSIDSDRLETKTVPSAQSRLREQRHNPSSPLGQSPPMVLSPSRLAHAATSSEVISSRGPSAGLSTHQHPPPRPTRPRPHPQISFDSLRFDDGAARSTAAAIDGNDDNDDNDNERTLVETSSQPTIPEFPRASASRRPPSATCYMCPALCAPRQGLCAACQERFRPQDAEWGDSDSDSEYEDMEVRTPSVSPRRTKPKPLSVRTAHAHHGDKSHNHSNSGFAALPSGPITPTHCPSFSRPITPTRSPQRAGTSRCYFSSPSSPGTPETPHGWSRSPHQAQRSHTRSQSSTVSPSQPQQLDAPTIAPAHVKSPKSPDFGSALFHLERSMQRENWEPLTPGVSPKHGHDVVRVGNVLGGGARRVVVRDSNDEGADTMKMLADEEEQEEERRSGGGGGYGDWFSHYAEKEGREAQNRTSSGSSIYERIQSIYDAYAGEDDEDDTEDMEMF